MFCKVGDEDDVVMLSWVLVCGPAAVKEERGGRQRTGIGLLNRSVSLLSFSLVYGSFSPFLSLLLPCSLSLLLSLCVCLSASVCVFLSACACACPFVQVPVPVCMFLCLCA